MSRCRLARGLLWLALIGLSSLPGMPLRAQPPPSGMAAEELQRLAERVRYLENRLGYQPGSAAARLAAEERPADRPPEMPRALPPMRLPERPPQRLPTATVSEDERLDELQQLIRRLEQQLTTQQRWMQQTAVEHRWELDQLRAESWLQANDWQQTMRPLDERTAAMAEGMLALDRDFEDLNGKLNQLDRGFGDAQKKLKETSDKLGEVTDPKWIESRLPWWVTTGFKLSGYLRTGYGINGKGGGLEEFLVPDGLFQTGWRLGNEKDTYGELGFEQFFNFREPDEIQVMVKSMVAYKYVTDKSNYTVDEDSDILVRESFVRVSHVLTNHPDVKFWAGERFYDRHDIYIDDLFAWDMSGWGGGVEDIDLGWGKLWIAYLGGTRDNLRDYGGAGSLTEQHLDFRIREIEMLEGKTMAWLDLAYVPGGVYTDFAVQSPYVTGIGDQGVDGNLKIVTYPQAVFENEFGVALGLIHERPLWGGFNKTFLMWGQGAAADFNTYVVVGKPPGAVGDQDRLFLANWFVKDVNECLSLMAVLQFDHDNVGQGYDGTYGYGFSQPERNLYSAGIRPIWMFTDHLALQFEGGVDYVDEIRYTPVAGDNGYLTKLTIAPTIRRGRKFWDKPELRLFATYAWWSSSGRGLVGLPAYAEVTEGWNFGVQAETWW